MLAYIAGREKITREITHLAKPASEVHNTKRLEEVTQGLKSYFPFIKNCVFLNCQTEMIHGQTYPLLAGGRRSFWTLNEPQLQPQP